jgi:hypothetical protein
MRPVADIAAVDSRPIDEVRTATPAYQMSPFAIFL